MMKAKALVPKHNRIRRSRGDIVFDIINVIIVVLITLTMIYPMWYVIIVSFATPEEAVMAACTYGRKRSRWRPMKRCSKTRTSGRAI